MGSGETTPATTTTQTTISPEQRQLLNMAMPYLQQFGQSNITAPGPESIAGFNPTQVAGQNQVLGSTMAMNNILTGAGQSNQFLTSGAALDPRSNPGLQGTIDASVRPIYQNLGESVLPALRGQAIVGGAGVPGANYGGSRLGIAEGLAARGASQAAGDTASKLAYQGYNTGLDAMLKSMGLAPSIAQSQAIPGLTTTAVGDTQRSLAQALLSAQTGQSQFEQYLPLLKGQAFLGGLNAIPGAGSVTTGPGVTQPSGLQTALGIGATGAGILGGLGALGGTSGLAGLLPLFTSSDMRLKRDIVRIGTLFDGTPVYRYRYAGNQATHIGVMAQDIEKFAPEAVTEIGGFKLVNLDLATRRAMEEQNGIAARSTNGVRSDADVAVGQPG